MIKLSIYFTNFMHEFFIALSIDFIYDLILICRVFACFHPMNQTTDFHFHWYFVLHTYSYDMSLFLYLY
jgi:hypothetical protein